MLEPLANLLDSESRHAWSVLDEEEGSYIVHNWRIPSDILPLERYSHEGMVK